MGHTTLDDEARKLEKELRDMRERLAGNNDRRRMGDPGPVSIARRVDVASTGNLFSLHGPTKTHRDSASRRGFTRSQIRNARTNAPITGRNHSTPAPA